MPATAGRRAASGKSPRRAEVIPNDPDPLVEALCQFRVACRTHPFRLVLGASAGANTQRAAGREASCSVLTVEVCFMVKKLGMIAEQAHAHWITPEAAV